MSPVNNSRNGRSPGSRRGSGVVQAMSSTFYLPQHKQKMNELASYQKIQNERLAEPKVKIEKYSPAKPMISTPIN
jgi:hypothetical protein